MNQEQTTPTPIPSPPQQINQQKVINIITIISLIFFWPVGLILMWLLTNWGKKTKIIVTVVLVLLFVLFFVARIWFVTSSLEDARAKARDATRKTDMRMMVTAQEMYYGGGDWYYYQSDGKTWPSAIGSYMMDVPTDPLEDVKTPYVWVDNTSDDQKFCIYATLEDGEWYTASHKGNYNCSDVKPTLNDCCF